VRIIEGEAVSTIVFTLSVEVGDGAVVVSASCKDWEIYGG
jgi:hypothetical protein